MSLDLDSENFQRKLRRTQQRSTARLVQAARCSWCVLSGAHDKINNEEEEGKGRSAKRPREIKISNFSHGSRVTKFRTMAQRAWR